MKARTALVAFPLGVLIAGAAVLHAQQVTKPTVAGVTNFARLETTIACAGATGPEAMPEIKKMGFVAVVNLRQASEAGANVEAGAAAAKAAGLKYIHIPFNAASPDPAVADKFVEELKKPENQPAFVHCGSANRAAAMWMIKRMTVDHWDAEKAGTEAAALGLTNPALKQFALDYAKMRSH